MTHLPADLLGRPAAQSVRLIALRYLDAATRALPRTRNPKDDRAFHDFRVALRRLRTTLRAYRPLLAERLSARPQKRLGEIARATNRVRDAEAALEWLRPLADGMKPRERIGLEWLIERIDGQRAREQMRCLAAIRRSFSATARGLRQGLVARRSIADGSFAGVLRVAAVEQARELDLRLDEIHHVDDEAAHRARIAAKRLRYVVEPVRGLLAGGDRLITRLKAIQDLLGELHDLQELDKTLAKTAGARSRARGTRAGLVAIARRIRIRKRTLFAVLRKERLGNMRTWVRAAAVLVPMD